jgi:hypothetical protein
MRASAKVALIVAVLGLVFSVFTWLSRPATGIVGPLMFLAGVIANLLILRLLRFIEREFFNDGQTSKSSS